MKILFPELANNQVATEASRHFPDIEFISGENLAESAEMLAKGQADTMISGLDYSSRDVLLAYKEHLPLKSSCFSSCFICERDDYLIALADGGVNKQPSKERLYTIIKDTAKTYQNYTSNQPKIALLSYSTYGSGGKNPDLDKYAYCLEKIRTDHPDWLIDGEMQLDTAINPRVSAKKTPGSVLKGRANVLITPDLNSGNILYKSLEQFGGFNIAGPLIQGFRMPLGDLSRGSTVEDTILTIKVLRSII